MTLELNADRFRTSLEQAASSSKLRINSEEMITVLHAKSTLVMAPLRDFDGSPATELHKGVDSVFAYVDSPDRGIPAGFYTLRVTANPTEVGEAEGTVEYVDLERQGGAQVRRGNRRALPDAPEADALPSRRDQPPRPRRGCRSPLAGGSGDRGADELRDGDRLLPERLLLV